MSIPPSKPDFRERFAYIRWVRQLGVRAEESDRDFAARSRVGYQWLQKWKKRSDAPRDRIPIARLVDYLMLGPLEERWLLDGEGEPPRPDLWVEWIAAFRGGGEAERPDYQRFAERMGLPVEERPARAAVGKKPAVKKTAKRRGA